MSAEYSKDFKVYYAAWKVSKYGVFSGPYFPVFGLNTEIYRTEYGDLLRKSPYSVQIQKMTDQKSNFLI